jgi:hypothetical protein
VDHGTRRQVSGGASGAGCSLATTMTAHVPEDRGVVTVLSVAGSWGRHHCPGRLHRAAQCEPDVPRRVHEGECASAARDAGHALSLTATSAPTLQVGTDDVAGWHRPRARPDPCVTAAPKFGTIRRSDARRRRHAPRQGSHPYWGWTERERSEHSRQQKTGCQHRRHNSQGRR